MHWTLNHQNLAELASSGASSGASFRPQIHLFLLGFSRIAYSLLCNSYLLFLEILVYVEFCFWRFSKTHFLEVILRFAYNGVSQFKTHSAVGQFRPLPSYLVWLLVCLPVHLFFFQLDFCLPFAFSSVVLVSHLSLCLSCYGASFIPKVFWVSIFKFILCERHRNKLANNCVCRVMALSHCFRKEFEALLRRKRSGNGNLAAVHSDALLCENYTYKAETTVHLKRN